jgi:NADH-ubiquinone oxidoreductase chain 4
MLPLASHQFTPLILTLATVSIIVTSLTTIRQIDLKKIIAYASIGHMNVLVVGFFVFNLTAATGSLLMHVSHGFVSSGLFLLIGAMYSRYYTRNVKYLRGLSGPLPVLSMLFCLLTFGNISVPGTFSFVSEILILMGSFSSNTFVASTTASCIFLAAFYSL